MWSLKGLDVASKDVGLQFPRLELRLTPSRTRLGNDGRAVIYDEEKQIPIHYTGFDVFSKAVLSPTISHASKPLNFAFHRDYPGSQGQ